MALYSVAELLHMTVADVMEMSELEFYGWVMRMNAQHKEIERRRRGAG